MTLDGTFSEYKMQPMNERCEDCGGELYEDGYCPFCDDEEDDLGEPCDCPPYHYCYGSNP